MEFDAERASGHAVRTVDVPVSERNRYSLTDEEVIELARYAVIIEKHYQRPMDIEWGRDGLDERAPLPKATMENPIGQGIGNIAVFEEQIRRASLRERVVQYV